MSWTDHQEKTASELRKFGLTMFAATGAITALLFLRGSSSWVYTASASGCFLLSGLLLPNLLRPVEKIWMLFAGILGYVMTNILLTIVFFIAVTPTGLLMRLFGRDPLFRRFDRNADSYWIDVESDGPGGRPYKPY